MRTLVLDPQDVIRSGATAKMSLVHMPTGIQVAGRVGDTRRRGGRQPDSVWALEQALWDELADEVAQAHRRCFQEPV